jgi:nitroreductase
MTVTEAINARRSTRAFLDRPVAPGLIRALIDLARRAPSGGNLQPWRLYVLAGKHREALVDAVRSGIATNPELAVSGEGAEYRIYPADLQEPYRSRRAAVGARLYESIAIAREDRAARLRQVARNYEFFGAPIGIIVTIERNMQQGQFVDVGLFLQSLALLAVEHGLATCMQESWANWHRTIRTVLPVPADELVFCGVSLGYPDADHPINRFATERAGSAEFCQFFGL